MNEQEHRAHERDDAADERDSRGQPARPGG
jgi:hypothetical protein